MRLQWDGQSGQQLKYTNKAFTEGRTNKISSAESYGQKVFRKNYRQYVFIGYEFDSTHSMKGTFAYSSYLKEQKSS